MNTAPRPGTAVWALGLLLLVLSAPPTARAEEEPTLGGLLAPAPFTVGVDDRVTVENRSTVTADVVITVSDPEYVVEPSTLVLEPGERARVAMVATGSQPAVLTAEYRPHDPPPGITGSVVLQADIRHPSPWETWPAWWPLLLLIPAVLVIAALRRFRNGRPVVSSAPDMDGRRPDL